MAGSRSEDYGTEIECSDQLVMPWKFIKISHGSTRGNVSTLNPDFFRSEEKKRG